MKKNLKRNFTEYFSIIVSFQVKKKKINKINKILNYLWHYYKHRFY